MEKNRNKMIEKMRDKDVKKQNVEQTKELCSSQASIDNGVQASKISILTNVILAIIKILTGIIGNSYALIADGIESTTDIISSIIVLTCLKISAKPADDSHPFGHGKAESIAGIIVSSFLLGAALLIATQSICEILAPHISPKWYTLLVLALVIITKEGLFRFVFKTGCESNSTALTNDAWHHRSDAITSAAVFIGITIALIGGKGYESADDWAALIACAVIIYNGITLLMPSLDEIMDASVSLEINETIREKSQSVDGVIEVEKCRVRKSGLNLLVDIHIIVNANITVKFGHDIAHKVKNKLLDSPLQIADVTVHVEPDHC